MASLLSIFTRRGERNNRISREDLLGSNPLFYKVLSVDKKILKIKRRRWN